MVKEENIKHSTQVLDSVKTVYEKRFPCQYENVNKRCLIKDLL